MAGEDSQQSLHSQNIRDINIAFVDPGILFDGIKILLKGFTEDRMFGSHHVYNLSKFAEAITLHDIIAPLIPFNEGDKKQLALEKLNLPSFIEIEPPKEIMKLPEVKKFIKFNQKLIHQPLSFYPSDERIPLWDFERDAILSAALEIKSLGVSVYIESFIDASIIENSFKMAMSKILYERFSENSLNSIKEAEHFFNRTPIVLRSPWFLDIAIRSSNTPEGVFNCLCDLHNYAAEPFRKLACEIDRAPIHELPSLKHEIELIFNDIIGKETLPRPGIEMIISFLFALAKLDFEKALSNPKT